MQKKLTNPFTGLQSNSKVLEWVMIVLQENEVDILTADRAEIDDKMHLLIGTLPRELRYSEKDVQAALNELERAAKEEKKTLLKASIAFTKPNNLLAQYTECIAGNQNKAFEAAKVGHFIWQIKRKLFGLPVSDQMMLVLTGPQAGGKSYTVENQLCSPIKDYIGKFDFGVFDQNFMLELYERNFVVFFDELSKMNKADANRLKFIITTPTLDDRIIHSGRFRQYKQNSTLIGTSNQSLGEQLQDTTGNRRFCEIQTLPTEVFKRNHKILESIDYVTLWQGVNENAPSPIVPFKEVLRMEQEEFTPVDHVKDFADDMLSVEDAFTSNAEIDEVYHKWCFSHGILRPYSRSILSKKLIDMGIGSTKKKDIRGLEVRIK